MTTEEISTEAPAVAASALSWSTEQPNPASVGLDAMPTRQVIDTIIAADAVVADAVAKVSSQMADAVELMVIALSSGGVVHYVGSGTSGRMGVLDAVELWPTFHVGSDQVQAHLAGGETAMMHAIEGAEDDAEAGSAIAAEAGPHDVIIGLAASGRTPYVRGALETGQARGLPTVLISVNPQSPLIQFADVAILPDTGPEVLTGSTRMKAATAQKMILNALSTATMVRLGKVFSNLMIDMIPTNQKLRARSIRMLQQGSGKDEQAAIAALNDADGDVRVALVSLISGAPADRARAALASHQPDAFRQGDPSGLRSAIQTAG